MKKIHWFTYKNLTNTLKKGDIYEIEDKNLIKQIHKILKIKSGENIVIKNQNFAYLSTIINISNINLNIKIEQKINQTPKKTLALMFCIPKKDKFELILEKCTEIGITDFYPIVSDRTIKTNINMERARKIIEEASEQAQIINSPDLHEIQNLDDIIEEYRPVIFDVEGNSFDKNENNKIQNFLIGPEGGFSEREIKLFRDKNLDIYKLGDTVLKTETAAIAISALLSY